MGKALYRKYRSKNLSEIIGQEHITNALQRTLEKGVISHAYLFTGPHGVGKTSIARILAHEVNKFEYDESKIYMDIIEIDAASNRRIDEIRDLREKVHTAPTAGKYKVYIIDEVHMLTKEAFNALLKTLEEPPSHVIFILATTEAHKLPETIISRTQRYSFKPVKQDMAIKHLATIAKKEKIAITDDALMLVADHGAGSFRDSISLLDQLGNHDREVDSSIVRAMLGLAEEESINKLLQAVGNGKISTVLSLLTELRQYGAEAARIASQLSSHLREMLINNDNSVLSIPAICRLLKELIDVGPSHNPDVMLEACLVETASKYVETPLEASDPASRNTEKRNAPQDAKITQVEDINKADITPEQKQEKTNKAPSTKDTAPEEKAKNAEKVPKTANTPMLDADIWQKVMDDLKRSHNTLYGVVRMAQAELNDGSVNMVVAFPFHQKRLNDDKNKRIILGLLEKHSGVTYKLVNTSVLKKPTTKDKESGQENIASITNIFGGGEVIE